MAPVKHFYVYTHSRPDGSVFYVGKGVGRRAWNFTHGRNPHHRSIINKHGPENIIVTTHPCEDELVAFALEKKMIADHPNLANMTDGGEGTAGRPISDKTRAAFDAYRATKPPMSEAHKAKCGATMKNAWATNPAMRENVERMTEARRGVPRPPHVVAALVAVHKGKKLSGKRLEQTRAAQQIAQEAAKAWHSSEEGVVWHVEHGKKSWENRTWHPCVCQECGRAFASVFPTRARFCDSRCAHRANRRKGGRPVGVRSQRVAPSVLSGKRAVGQQQ